MKDVKLWRRKIGAIKQAMKDARMSARCCEPGRDDGENRGNVTTMYFPQAGDSLLHGSHKQGWAVMAGMKILFDGLASWSEAEKTAYLAGYEPTRIR